MRTHVLVLVLPLFLLFSLSVAVRRDLYIPPQMTARNAKLTYELNLRVQEALNCTARFRLPIQPPYASCLTSEAISLREACE